MKKITAALSALALTGISLFAMAPDAQAADRTCRGTISNTTISGNVHVPSGASCNLEYVVVRGDVKLGTGSSVRIYGKGVFGNVQGESSPANITIHNTRIYGDVQAKKARSVRVTRANVNGNIQSESGAYELYVANSSVIGDVQTKYQPLRVESTRVGGNIQHEEGKKSFIVRNQVSGDVQVFKNRQEQRISYNTVRGNLQCKENSPAPVGGVNKVSGSKEDQCRRL